MSATSMASRAALVKEPWRQIPSKIGGAPAPSSAQLTNPLAAFHPFEFELPDALSAREPTEARGLARDEVRLMVSGIGNDAITHARFHAFPEFLSPGDVLVVNASATINAALDAWREGADGQLTEQILLHVSSPMPDEIDELRPAERITLHPPSQVPGKHAGERWVVELRRVTANGSMPLLDAHQGERIHLRAGASAKLAHPYFGVAIAATTAHVRLWVATLSCPDGVLAYTAEHGSPIRYGYVPAAWPLEYYQTVFSAEPGSAEMASAGRAFTPEIVERLKKKNVTIAPLVLHSGVSSLESDEPPYPERYHVPAATADAVNDARSRGGRVVAVGTTAVRALETVASADGRVWPGAGWTDLVLTRERGIFAVDAMLTGLHAPRASHLAILESLSGRRHLSAAYGAALSQRYLWHEFGDLHLMLPG